MKINNLLLKIVLLAYILTVLFSCKEKEIIPEPPDSDDFYFIATINEKSKNLVSSRNGYRLSVTTQEIDGDTPDIVNVLYTSGLAQLNTDYYIKSSEAANVIFNNNWFSKADYLADKNTYFTTVFSVGSRVFCSETDLATPCVEIYWKDTYGKEWSTRYGSQVGSLYNITSVNETAGSSGESLKLAKATFNCKLYNELGTALVLKNGQHFLIFKRE